MSTLSDRLKSLRNEHGLLQKDMAKKLNITSSAYGFYEQNKRVPDSNTLNKLAQIFNVSLDYLMGVSDIRNPQANISINLTTKDKKDIAKDIDQMRQELLRQRNGEDSDTLLFDGEPMSDESIDQILAALEIGMEMVKKKNKAKYTPKKYQR